MSYINKKRTNITKRGGKNNHAALWGFNDADILNINKLHVINGGYENIERLYHFHALL